MSQLERFYALFVNRETRIGLSEPVMKGKEKSVEIEPQELRPLMEQHLMNPASQGVGCYAVDEDGNSWWGCYDFDSKTSEPARDAHYALTAIQRAGLDGVIEVSRSGEGRHVWIFLDEPVPADELRKCLLLVDEAAALECGEINPKQRVGTDHSKNLGNYVRLPYHARWVNEGRMVCLDEHGEFMDLATFLDHAEAHQTDHKRVLELAGKYHPKPPPRREVPVGESRRDRVPSTSTQDAHLIMRGGPILHEGGFHDGRNNKAWNFACYLSRHNGYKDDIDAAHAKMERVWSEQLEQYPDHIPLDVFRSMITRAFEEAANA